MVTAPIDPANPEYSSSYSIYDIFGVSTNAQHHDEAALLMDFIAHVSSNSRLIAKNKTNYGLPAVTDYMNPIGDHDLYPFYELKPIPNQKFRMI
ncbi:hypothetical protein [Paenibacillus sp. Leaf72]|uniref:hypothetical protein n=1 Tax=Paenibacillus sp. Leaf72 TaxID=1736234 RepID=UPI0012DFD801|nr:hypothetical protein [Paenibacillus sp. Leaf72]